MASTTPTDVETSVDAPWEPPAPGVFSRSFRFSEWISEPVTPLFESWLLTRLEDQLHDTLERWVGQRAPYPRHVVVNGWYFYSLNWLGGPAVARNMPRLLAKLVRSPRRVAGLIPPTVRYSIPLFEREWRDETQPRYRVAVADAEAAVDELPVEELPLLIDRLADEAGRYFASVAALGGAAYKLEMNLAQFCRRHLADALSDSHLPLLAGLETPVDPPAHSVASLDWWFPTGAKGATATRSGEDHERLVEARLAAEAAADRILSSSPRRLRSFRSLLVEAQRMAVVHEEQVEELTLAWPVMRQAVERIGGAVAETGAISEPDDIYFLTRAEATAALGGESLSRDIDVAARRSTRQRQAALVPPLLIGSMNRVLRSLMDAFPRGVGARPSQTAVVTGTPVSPGRSTGSVRVIRGPAAFGELQPGEILVAPLTAPAWTPLFTRAAAVVTDIGSAASHASIIAREYGIPAVVGCGDATARLRTGMVVSVDGSTGNVELG